MSPPVNSHNHEEQGAPDQRKSFWGIRCEGGKVYSRVLSNRCNMTMAALEPNTCRPENPWVSLLMERSGSEFLLCSLKNDFIMQVNLNLIFEKEEKIKFYVRGQGVVHLSGYQEGSSADTEDDIIDKQVKIPTAMENYPTIGKSTKKGHIYCQICNIVIKSEHAWIEHIQKKKHMKNFKRQCTSAGIDTFDTLRAEIKGPSKMDSSVSDGTAVEKKNKSPSSAKKIKNMPSTSNAVSSDEEDSEVQEISPNMPSGSGGKAGSSGEQVRTILSKNLIKVITEIADSEDNEEEDKDFNEFDEEESDYDEEESDYDEEDSEDDDELDEDDDSDSSGDMVNRTLEAQKRKRDSDASDSRKRAKKDNSVPEASTSGASQMPIEIFEVDDDQNSSASDEDSDDSSEDEGSTFKKSPLINAQKSNKKKKSNDSAHQGDSNSKPNAGKAENNLDIQDLRAGYGPPAKAGKTVQVFYTGRFQHGQIFDQTPVGKPFSFKLGAGQVIKGWDLGIEGMKVGGKRKITVPPHLGYGTKGNDDIPANSTLIFHVELKSIS